MDYLEKRHAEYKEKDLHFPDTRNEIVDKSSIDAQDTNVNNKNVEDKAGIVPNIETADDFIVDEEFDIFVKSRIACKVISSVAQNPESDTSFNGDNDNSNLQVTDCDEEKKKPLEGSSPDDEQVLETRDDKSDAHGKENKGPNGFQVTDCDEEGKKPLEKSSPYNEKPAETRSDESDTQCKKDKGCKDFQGTDCDEEERKPLEGSSLYNEKVTETFSDEDIIMVRSVSARFATDVKEDEDPVTQRRNRGLLNYNRNTTIVENNANLGWLVLFDNYLGLEVRTEKETYKPWKKTTSLFNLVIRNASARFETGLKRQESSSFYKEKVVETLADEDILMSHSASPRFATDLKEDEEPVTKRRDRGLFNFNRNTTIVENNANLGWMVLFDNYLGLEVRMEKETYKPWKETAPLFKNSFQYSFSTPNLLEKYQKTEISIYI